MMLNVVTEQTETEGVDYSVSEEINVMKVTDSNAQIQLFTSEENTTSNGGGCGGDFSSSFLTSSLKRLPTNPNKPHHAKNVSGESKNDHFRDLQLKISFEANQFNNRCFTNDSIASNSGAEVLDAKDPHVSGVPLLTEQNQHL